MVSQIIILIVLITLNAFFAGSEIAFISLNTNKLKSMSEEGNKKAGIVLKLKAIPNQFLSTIQIGVSLSSMLSGAFASEAFAQVLTNWIVTNGFASEAAVKPLAMIIITLITSYLMLVFGELVPKRLAMTNPERFAFTVVRPIYGLSIITKPIVKFLSFSTNLVLRLMGVDPHKTEDEVTEEEIRIMVDAGVIEADEKEMINNVFEFDNIDVSDIMTHRTDVVGIDIESTYDEIMHIVEDERFTRYPVYEESIDNIIGVLHLRDLLRYARNGKTTLDLRKLIREPYFVPESKLTNQLFKELQAQKTHIAIVIDEYGGTAGIVTMEDIIEEIMGNIMDEYDEDEENDIIMVHPGEYLVGGACDLEELAEVLEIELPIDDYDTVSGFVVGELGRLPSMEDIESEESDIIYEGYRFSIVDVDEKVISKVRVTVESQPVTEAAPKD